MSYEIKTFSIEECKRWVDDVTSRKYDSPADCLKELESIDMCFREAMLDKVRFEEIPVSLKDRIRDLLKYCAPAINYEIEELSEISQKCELTDNKSKKILEKVFWYELKLKSTPEEIADQIDTFYSAAIAALSDPLFSRGITPLYLLKCLVDSYWLETGVRDPEEKERIVSQLVKRFFVENPDYISNDTLSDFMESAEPDDGQKSGVRALNIEELKKSIRSMRKSVARYVSDKCKDMPHPNSAIFSDLSQWIKLPKFEITSGWSTGKTDHEGDESSQVDWEEKIFNIEKYEELSDILAPVLEIISESLTQSLLKTSAKAIKRDLENIKHDESNDMSALLKKVICDNFNIELIEIDDEGDRYATPEYFDVSRANIKEKVKTTIPAILDKKTGLTIIKGRYLVPLASAETENLTNTHKKNHEF